MMTPEARSKATVSATVPGATASHKHSLSPAAETEDTEEEESLAATADS